MSENKYTPGPWTTKQSHLYGNETMLVDKDDHYIASIRANSDLSDGDSQDIARRITACVNACAGVDTELLEIIADNDKTLAGVIANVEKQRDELLAALERCRFALEPYDDIKPRDWKSDRLNLRDAHQVAAAILKATKTLDIRLNQPDFRQMREMLRSMQAGELTVSRGIEILEMWWAGNWSDNMLPPVRQDLIEEDSMPVEIIDRLKTQLAASQEEIESNKAYFTTLLEEQRVLLAKAEQRAAEACALTYLEDYDLTDIAERIRSGEWRKFLKEM